MTSSSNTPVVMSSMKWSFQIHRRLLPSLPPPPSPSPLSLRAGFLVGERAKKTKGENEVYARLAPLADLFSPFFSTAELNSQAFTPAPSDPSLMRLVTVPNGYPSITIGVE